MLIITQMANSAAGGLGFGAGESASFLIVIP
jgi:hypothetical protein